MMPNKILFAAILLFLLHGTAASGERAVTPEQLEEIGSTTLLPFFKALKEGDIAVIKQYISDEMYQETRVLLEENTGYADFLRAHYKNAVFSVDRGIISEDGVLVDYTVEFPGRGRLDRRFSLQEQESIINNNGKNQSGSRGRWRISEQRNGRNH